jgi:hypothetical protein
VWIRKSTSRGVRFHIDRTHPVIQSLVNANCSHAKLLQQILDLIERSLPIASIIAEPAKSLDGTQIALTEDDIQGLVDLAFYTESFLIKHGLSPQTAREKLLLAEPFVQFRDQIISRLPKR